MNEEDILRAIEQTKLFIRVKTFYLVIFLIFALATPLFEKVYNATSDQIRRYNLLVIIAVVICLPVYARRIMEANNDIKNYRNYNNIYWNARKFFFKNKPYVNC